MSHIPSLYCDGGVIQVNPSPYDGTWAWVRIEEDGRDVSAAGYVVGADNPFIQRPVSNNVSELYALLQGLLSLPEGWSGMVYSDSKITLGRVFQSWALAGVPDCLRDQIVPAKARLGKVQWMLLDGHPTREQLASGIGKRGNPVSKFNAECDRMCNELSRAFLKRLDEVKGRERL